MHMGCDIWVTTVVDQIQCTFFFFFLNQIQYTLKVHLDYYDFLFSQVG